MNILSTSLLEHRNLEHALSASSILSRTNLKGIITSVNKNFADMSGYSEAELIGQKHSIINSHYHPKEFWTKLWKTIAAGNNWRGEIRNQAKDGSFYWVDTFIYPFVSASGKPVEYFSVRNDITEKKEYEAAIVHRNEILTTIAWKQSHEIRRPVASILGLLQLLDESFSSVQSNREVLDKLKDSAQELDHLVKSIVRLTEDGEYNTPAISKADGIPEYIPLSNDAAIQKLFSSFLREPLYHAVLNQSNFSLR